MASTQTIPRSFLLEMASGVHSLSSDVFKIALYDGAATLDETTTAYTADNEVSGTGYTAGGETIPAASGFPKIATEGSTYKLLMDFDDAVWTSATFTAAAALIYNSSKQDRAVCVIDLGGSTSVVSGTFTITFPQGDFSSAFMQFSVSTTGR